MTDRTNGSNMNKAFAFKIKGELLKRGYSLARLAEEYEISRQLISRYLNSGINSPKAIEAIESVIGPIEQYKEQP